VANLQSFFAFFVHYKKNLCEEYDEAINFASASDCRSSPSLNCWTRYIAEHHTWYWQIHDYKVHEASLATVTGLSADVTASRVLRVSRYLGHTDNQRRRK